MKSLSYVLILFLVLLSSRGFASEQNNLCRVEFSNNRLSVYAENVSLHTVLKRIQERTGLEFVLAQDLAQKIISVRIEPLPLKEALEKPLEQFSYIFAFESKGKESPSKVFILEESDKQNAGDWNGSKPDIEFMTIEPSNGEVMEITSSSETMVVEPPGNDGMPIVHYFDPMFGKEPAFPPAGFIKKH